jgi:sirohydrochlorin ferrochelatase
VIPLVAVAHGSRDPRSAASIHSLLDVVRSLRPELDVRGCFLDLCAPRLSDVLRGPAVVVPLLLGKAYHARVDVPAAVAESRVPAVVTDVLGPDPRLESAALRRLSEAGIDFGDRSLGVVLAGAGSSHGPANEAVAHVARRWARESGWAGVEAAFASIASPTVPWWRGRWVTTSRWLSWCWTGSTRRWRVSRSPPRAISFLWPSYDRLK